MRRPLTLTAIAALGAVLVAPVALASPDAGPATKPEPIETLVRVRLPSSDLLTDLQDAGVE